MAVTVPATVASELARDRNVVSVEPDALRHPASDPLPLSYPNVEQVRPFGIDRVQAPQVWAEGYTGEGVTVCVIDTGLYWEHEDIADYPGDYIVGGTSQDPDSETISMRKASSLSPPAAPPPQPVSSLPTVAPPVAATWSSPLTATLSPGLKTLTATSSSTPPQARPSS
ncbi:MAG: hypothetical protein RRC07_11760 [Anaerolineae bacterium]|nr:hypothetical protein [Anaerolineae bacterium]